MAHPLSRRPLTPRAGALAAALLAACHSARPGPRTPTPTPERTSVGYGTQDTRSVTGAVSSVTPDDVTRHHATAIQQLLQGRIAGVQVTPTSGGDFSVRIRGTNSILGSSEPLYVVDGVMINAPTLMSALGGIAPSDVDHIDVLKDAGATSIYGSRGANGVLVITTKRH